MKQTKVLLCIMLVAGFFGVTCAQESDCGHCDEQWSIQGPSCVESSVPAFVPCSRSNFSCTHPSRMECCKVRAYVRVFGDPCNEAPWTSGYERLGILEQREITFCPDVQIPPCSLLVVDHIRVKVILCTVTLRCSDPQRSLVRWREDPIGIEDYDYHIDPLSNCCPTPGIIIDIRFP